MLQLDLGCACVFWGFSKKWQQRCFILKKGGALPYQSLAEKADLILVYIVVVCNSFVPWIRQKRRESNGTMRRQTPISIPSNARPTRFFFGLRSLGPILYEHWKGGLLLQAFKKSKQLYFLISKYSIMHPQQLAFSLLTSESQMCP